MPVPAPTPGPQLSPYLRGLLTEMILEQVCVQFESGVITQGDNWNLRGARHSGVSRR